MRCDPPVVGPQVISPAGPRAFPAWGLICPLPLDDETLFSFVTRWSHLNGRAAVASFLRSCFGIPIIDLGLETLSARKLGFCRRLAADPAFGNRSATKLLTTWSFHLYFHSKSVRDELFATSPPLDTKFPVSPLYWSRYPGFKQRPHPVACLQCMREDKTLIGCGWWRRSHHLPGVSKCHRHGTKLVIGCNSCGNWMSSQRNLVLPSTDCACGNFEPRYLDLSYLFSPCISQRFAEVSSDMLLDEHPSDLSAIKVVLGRAVEDRYGNRDDRWHLLANDIYGERIGDDQRRKTISWARRACSAGVDKVALDRYALLIALLFGGLSHIKAAIADGYG